MNTCFFFSIFIINITLRAHFTYHTINIISLCWYRMVVRVKEVEAEFKKFQRRLGVRSWGTDGSVRKYLQKTGSLDGESAGDTPGLTVAAIETVCKVRVELLE